VAQGDAPHRLAPPIASLNYLLTSHVWRQDHNGFSHQDPGFIDHVVNKKAEVVRVYLPPDANTLLSVADHCLRSRNYVNVIVAGKQPEAQWLDIDARAPLHGGPGHLGLGQQRRGRSARRGDGLRGRRAHAGDDGRGRPAAHSTCPTLKVRVVNVVDLMALQSPRAIRTGWRTRTSTRSSPPTGR
jgi:xylulose-5-phosphate/fructose-6-phosphate phosphoketolase